MRRSDGELEGQAFLFEEEARIRAFERLDELRREDSHQGPYFCARPDCDSPATKYLVSGTDTAAMAVCDDHLEMSRTGAFYRGSSSRRSYLRTGVALFPAFEAPVRMMPSIHLCLGGHGI